MPLYGDIIIALALIVVAVVATVSTRKVRLVNRRFRLLDEIAQVAEEGRTLDETLVAITEAVVPELGDICAIDVIEGESVRRAALKVDGPDAESIGARLLASGPRLQAQVASEAARGRQPPLHFEMRGEEDCRAFAEDEEDLEFLRTLGVFSGVAIELRARGRPTGVLTISVGPSGRRFDAVRRPLRHHPRRPRRPRPRQRRPLLRPRACERERAEIAETLQRGLLPPPLPHIPGWSVAATYRPAGAENELGGDFYDAFRISGGWMVVIGDVTGRGAKAAAVTAHARYTLRTAAALTGDPVVALATLNRELISRRGRRSAASSRWRSPKTPPAGAAGGRRAPAAAARRPRVGRRGRGARAPVLGAFTDETGRGGGKVHPGQQLVVITDGVTECAGAEDRFGEERLRAAAGRSASPAIAVQRIEGALHEFSRRPARGRRRDHRDRPDARRRRPGAASRARAGRAALRGLQPARRRGDRGPLRRGPRLLPGRHRRGRSAATRPTSAPPASASTSPTSTAPGKSCGSRRPRSSGAAAPCWSAAASTPAAASSASATSRWPGSGTVADGCFIRGEVFPDPEEALRRLAAPPLGSAP